MGRICRLGEESQPHIYLRHLLNEEGTQLWRGNGREPSWLRCRVAVVCHTAAGLEELALLPREELSQNRVGTVWLSAQDNLHG